MNRNNLKQMGKKLVAALAIAPTATLNSAAPGEKTRLRDFFAEKDCTELIAALDGYEIPMSSKQMDWSDSIIYRFERYGMAAYCNEADKQFITSMMTRLKLERQAAA